MGRRHTGLSFYHRKKKISAGFVKEILSWIFSIFATLLISAVVVYAVGLTTSMVGSSMEPELINGELICVNRYSYLLAKPKAGDIVAFYPKGNKNSHIYIKRVVAVKGDTIQITEGHLYVNNIKMKEETDKMSDAGIAENPIHLENNEYFLLGDNRNYSEDSRSANIGVVELKDIIGRVWLKLPKDKAGLRLIK